MAYVSDYTFNGMSRMGNDACCIDQNSIQNVAACNYTLQNFFASDCNMTSARSLAVSQPCINYSGAYGMAATGCNVDDSSRLLIGQLQTHPKTRLDLFGRTFATVPFLGRGSVDPVLESQIRQGEGVTNKRSHTLLAEKNYAQYNNMPMIPEVQQHMQYRNVALSNGGDMRGGVASRELTRDIDFHTTHTAGQYN